jgi:ABC-type nitrate/sulfonate/bicarbonate transport system ATPase subunit
MSICPKQGPGIGDRGTANHDSQSLLFYCKNITKNYDNVPVVKDISLSLPQGGFISLLGPSGVGKTTLFNALAGIDPPDEGSVWLNGEDITGIPGRVGYMPQKDLLLEHRTVLDNVILPHLIRGEKKKTAREKAAVFFPQFGLSGFEKKYPCQLSGGMRQRAALLRTCQTGSKTILLDEPFSALDAITRAEMQNWYMEIALTMRLSTFFITHDVEEALLLSDTVYILNGKPGRITNVFEALPGRPRNRGFVVSRDFADQKRKILDAISGS